MISNNQKLSYILAHGWETYGKNSYVKTEWLHDPRGHLSPNWYRSETLDSAYNIEMQINEKDKEKEDYLLANGWEINGSGYVMSKWTNKNNLMTTEAAYQMAMADLNDKRRS